MSSLIRFIAELSRRKVLRATGGYIVAVWLLSTQAVDLFGMWGLDWAVKAFVAIGVLGIPVVVLVSWHFNLTVRGFVRELDDVVEAESVSDRPPGDARKWAGGRHDMSSTGYLTITWTDGEGKTHRERFFEPLVVGRDALSTIQLSDQRVSRRHTVLWAERGAWHARDLGSSNGTFVDGRRITSETLPAHCEMRLDRHGPSLRLQVDTTESTLVSLNGETMVGFRPDDKN